MGGCMAASGFGIHFGEGESVQIPVSRNFRDLDGCRNFLSALASIMPDAFASDRKRLSDFLQRVLRAAPRQGMKCGATMLMNSRDVITLVFFQNFGKCRWLPVIK